MDKHGWISVTDRLPESGKRVLIWAYGGIYMDHIMADNLAEPWNKYMADEVSHWMPLPLPPEE